jgi:hypothetical protein
MLAEAARRRLEARSFALDSPEAGDAKVAFFNAVVDQDYRKAHEAFGVRRLQGASALACRAGQDGASGERLGEVDRRASRTANESSASAAGVFASTRLLNSGPDTCDRIEHQAVLAMEAADWGGARRLLHLRLRMHLQSSVEERKVIDRVLELIDQAEESGMGPAPLRGNP